MRSAREDGESKRRRKSLTRIALQKIISCGAFAVAHCVYQHRGQLMDTVYLIGALICGALLVGQWWREFRGVRKRPCDPEAEPAVEGGIGCAVAQTGTVSLAVPAQQTGAAAACTSAAGVDPSSRAREPALGLSTDRGRAQESGARSLTNHCAQGLGLRWRSAGARAHTAAMAVLPAPAGCQRARL